MKKPVGVLLLHGFTGLPETVDGLVPHLEKAGIPYRLPCLRGHWTKPEDMLGVTATDWVVDAKQSLDELLQECDKVVVVALSMGGLVALQLAMDRPQDLAGVVTVAAALRYLDPLVAITPILAALFKFWPMPIPKVETAYGAPKNYASFPTKTFASMLAFSKGIEASLEKVAVPIRILHSRVDKVITPKSAQIIHDRVSSSEKELIWFERSGHEMMMDWEKERVFELIMEFVAKRQALQTSN